MQVCTSHSVIMFFSVRTKTSLLAAIRGVRTNKTLLTKQIQVTFGLILFISSLIERKCLVILFLLLLLLLIILLLSSLLLLLLLLVLLLLLLL